MTPLDPVDVPTLRATSEGGTVVVRATGPVVVTDHPAGGEAALQAFGDEYAAGRQVLPLAEPPAVWCSWYHYFEQVTAADIAGEPARRSTSTPSRWTSCRSTTAGAPVSAKDWCPRPEFGSLPALVDAIRASGRRAGLWLAPFLVGTRTTLAREHPDWLVGPAGRNWGQDLAGLDLTHPGVQDLLRDVLGRCGRAGRGLPQARLPLRRCGARPAARRRGRGGGLPHRAGAGPGGGRTGRVPRRLRGTAAPERGTGGRDARLARHLPRGRRGRLRWAAGADASGGPGVDAGPALGQRPRLRRGAAVVPAARAVGRARPAASAGCRPSPTASPTWTTGAWRPWAGLLAAGGSGAPLSADRVREGAELAQAEGSA